MKKILQGYERLSVNSSGGVLTVRSVKGAIELQAKGREDVLLEIGDQIKIGDVRNIIFQNMADSVAEIEYDIYELSVNKKAQSISASITNKLDIQSMPAVQVEATVAAAATAGDSITVVLAAGQTAQILPININRHSAFISRDESDLYNVKLGYNTPENAQAGIPFAPQASASVSAKAAVYAHNHSAFEQTVIAVDTSIDTGA